MSDEPVMARKGPYGVVVKKGETYFWCACGRSKSQPFCDGSHKGTEFSPVKYVAEEKVMVAFCGCKQSKCQPYCDDSHIAIVVEEEEVDESTKPRIF
jgi:CDGSH iron-sulfur domain-containing protein 3